MSQSHVTGNFKYFPEYSETISLCLGLDQFFGLGLGLDIEMSDVYNQLKKYLVSDLILIKKLTKLQFLTLPQSWDTGTTSLRLSFKIKAQKILVADLVFLFTL